jgi:hypothetical protein
MDDRLQPAELFQKDLVFFHSCRLQEKIGWGCRSLIPQMCKRLRRPSLFGWGTWLQIIVALICKPQVLLEKKPKHEPI